MTRSLAAKAWYNALAFAKETNNKCRCQWRSANAIDKRKLYQLYCLQLWLTGTSKTCPLSLLNFNRWWFRFRTFSTETCFMLFIYNMWHLKEKILLGFSFFIVLSFYHKTTQQNIRGKLLEI